MNSGQSAIDSVSITDTPVAPTKTDTIVSLPPKPVKKKRAKKKKLYRSVDDPQTNVKVTKDGNNTKINISVRY